MGNISAIYFRYSFIFNASRPIFSTCWIISPSNFGQKYLLFANHCFSLYHGCLVHQWILSKATSIYTSSITYALIFCHQLWPFCIRHRLRYTPSILWIISGPTEIRNKRPTIINGHLGIGDVLWKGHHLFIFSPGPGSLIYAQKYRRRVLKK